MNEYSSICEIGCFNGRVTFQLKEFLKDKIYIGYDLNIFAISIARLISFFKFTYNKKFYCQNATYSSSQNCELFVSVATLIYFSEDELMKFLGGLKNNDCFRSLIMHEIFINEDFITKKKSLVEDNLNIHSISMIKEQFNNDFKIEVRRTFYNNWESKERISAILTIKKI